MTGITDTTKGYSDLCCFRLWAGPAQSLKLLDGRVIRAWSYSRGCWGEWWWCKEAYYQEHYA